MRVVSDYPVLNMGFQLYRGDEKEDVCVKFLKALLLN
jgi:hypothetical protein